MEINWPELLVGGLIGFAAALLVVVIVEGFRGPKLEFQPHNADPGKFGRRDGAIEDVKFVHIEVTNRRRRWFAR